jgi:hypothetical protein
LSDEKKGHESGGAIAALSSKTMQSESVLHIGGDSILLQRSENFTYSTKSISPELATHEFGLAKLDSETRMRLAEIESARTIGVAEKEYVTPIRVMVRPMWAIIAILAVGGWYGMQQNAGHVAEICAGGLAVTPLVDAILRRLRKKE